MKTGQQKLLPQRVENLKASKSAKRVDPFIAGWIKNSKATGVAVTRVEIFSTRRVNMRTCWSHPVIYTLVFCTLNENKYSSLIILLVLYDAERVLNFVDIYMLTEKKNYPLTILLYSCTKKNVYWMKLCMYSYIKYILHVEWKQKLFIDNSLIFYKEERILNEISYIFVY